MGEPCCRSIASDSFSVISLKMTFERDLDSAFTVSFVMAEQRNVAQISCLSSSSATFFSEIKREGRLLYCSLCLQIGSTLLFLISVN